MATFRGCDTKNKQLKYDKVFEVTEWFAVLFTSQYILWNEALLRETFVHAIHSVIAHLWQHLILLILKDYFIIVILYLGLFLSLQ